jgi:hypothetical protein
MKTNSRDNMSNETAFHRDDWWRRANAAGLALSGVWADVLIKPRYRQDSSSAPDYPLKKASLQAKRVCRSQVHSTPWEKLGALLGRPRTG